MPQDVRLLPTQRKEVFEALRKAGFNPAEFRWDDVGGWEPALVGTRRSEFLASRLTYLPKPEFGIRFGGSVSSWSPGRLVRTDGDYHCGNWGVQANQLNRWLAALAREVGVEDPWEALVQDLTAALGDAEQAASSLAAVGAQTAKGEIEEARRDIKRDPADVTGAVQHSMTALECIARQYTGEPNATLGELVKTNPGLFPAPLDEAIRKVWGFASNMGRHLNEGQPPDQAEAELLVGVATVCCTYVARKFATRPGPASPRPALPHEEAPGGK